MAQKYEIYCESGWDEANQVQQYERLTTLKNERAAIDFISNIDNIGKYGNMMIRTKQNGNVLTYNEKKRTWE